MASRWYVDGPVPAREPEGRVTLRLRVDYGQRWPLNDHIGARPADPIEWRSILSPELYDRLVAWAAFFNQYADHRTGLYGSEERRKWFDQEGRRLLIDLRREAGDRFDFTLHLWF
ncbi:hypothetical protein A6122_2865 [Rathayibacter tritici]|uniref:Uncharacterized protein n=1 Tax=Rathayibacter tritici TaxID=33888 RepID=A0A160KVZ3_9MICO|nr:hypothetical protein A6122_2865 [Rathayibacter tritici]